MPRILEHIDAIARQKQRDVLFVYFHPKNWGDLLDDSWRGYNYHEDKRRSKLLAWLDANGIKWQECGHFATETGFRRYLGEIYLDVPFDENDPTYRNVRDYLENPDGSMRDERVRFYLLTLERAMTNAHHDEPGFWEKWAETF